MLACVLLAIAVAAPLAAQTAPVTHVDNFQSYGTQKNPPGWVDTSIGSSKPIAGGLYKTWPDPLQGNKGPNVVFGTKQSSGKPEGNNPRIGTFSTLSTKTFSGSGRFEYRGRFIRTNSDSRVGLTFFSSYPEKDQYYLVGLWTQPSTGKLTMQLFGFGGGAPSGTTDSNFTPEPNKWYAFAIQGDDVGGRTQIRARFWLDSNPEPQTWSIDAVDATAGRLTQGRIGIWSAVKGEVYVDDLSAKSPVDHTAPVISVMEDVSKASLQNNARFGYEPVLIVTATDDFTAQPRITQLLDGSPYTNGTRVTQQGNHTLFVRAEDSVGNATELTLRFYVDTIPPAIIVNTPQPNAQTASPVTIEYQATDATPPITVTGLLDGQAWTPLDKPITTEGDHVLQLGAKDALDNAATLPAIPFVIDLTPPVAVLKANGQALTTDDRIFGDDVRITLDVTDRTPTTETLLVDGGAYTENAPITTEGTHRVSGSATDAVGHVTPVAERRFIIDKSAPVVVVRGNGEPMQTYYKVPVDLTIEITDFSPTTTVAKLNAAPFTFPGRADAENKYVLEVTVSDSAGHSTTLPPIEFYVDLSDPKVTVLANGAPFQDVYAVDVNITVTTEDLTPLSKTITLDQQAITPPTLVTAEEPIPHVFAAVVSDAVGHTTTIAPIRFTIDKTAPAVTIRNGQNGSVIEDGDYFNAAVRPFLEIDDRTAVTITATLADQPFTNGMTVSAERSYVLTGVVRDLAGNETAVGPLTFHIDTTPPVGVFMEGEAAFPDGQSVKRDVSARVKVTDASPVTTEIFLNGAAYVADTPITAEVLHTLTATMKDAAGNTGVVPSVSVRIDRTPPDVSLEANGQAFPRDFAFNKDIAVDAHAEDVSGIAEKWAVLDPGNERVTVPFTHTREGEFTITAFATDKAGNTGQTAPIRFILEKTPPQVLVKIDGADAIPNFAYDHDVVVTIEVADGLTSRTIHATLNGQPFTSGTLVSQESVKDSPHVIAGTVTTASGIVANIPVTPFILDKTPPAVTLKNRTEAFPASGSWLNADVVPVAECEDAITRCTVKLVLDGAEWPNATAVSTEKTETPYRLVVTATDDAGNEAQLDPVEFFLDKTNPVITITEPANDAILTTPETLVRGTSDDAVTLQVEGIAATIDGAAKTFVTTPLALVEGENILSAVGVDRAGNVGNATVRVVVDTRGPQLSVRTPAPNACIASNELVIAGVVNDPNVASVIVTVGEQSVSTALAADRLNWTATFTNVAEGPQTVTVEARDAQGHRTVASLPLFVDRGNPVVEVLEAGAPFTAKLVNRPVALTIRASDLDPSVRVFATYRGAPYASGTVISGDGAHHIDVVAIDCAGHQTAVPVDFTIKTSAPVFNSFTPPNHTTLGAMPASVGGNVTGAVRVTVDGTSIAAVPNAQGDYVLAGVQVAEGRNAYPLRAVDAAGNVATALHTFTVKTTAPTVEIYEDGSVLPDGKLFNREVRLTFRSSDPGATIAAVVDGFTYSGQPIGADGEHVVEVTATNAELGLSGDARRTFRIDRTPPDIEITAPPPGPVTTKRVDVIGNADDAQVVIVNGVAATIDASRVFRATGVLLDPNENVVIAVGTDAAGNSGTDQVVLTYATGPGIVLNSPPEGLLTNRPRVDVIGRVLSPVRGDVVTIGSKTVPVDGSGAFRFDGYQLVEGANEITATAIGLDDASTQTRATVRVTADFTPPVVTVRADEQLLVDDAQFPGDVAITATATDAGAAIATQLTIDGASRTQPATVTARGGHVLAAFAADAAGNETRVDRTFFIGASATTSGCTVLSTDPRTNSVVTTPSVTIAGQAPGAVSVKVAGVNAQVADGTFSATIDLPNEGANLIHIQCSAGEGLGTGSLDITLHRSTGLPTIEITEPTEGLVTGTSPIDVRGRVTGDVKSVAVNGVNATVTGDTFEAKEITLAGGVNILLATARSNSDRTASDSVRVTYLEAEPSVAITSPLPDYETGASSIAVTGAWSDLDPSTLSINVTGATRETPVLLSHTNGTFRFTGVPLAAGEQTLTITGRNTVGRTATASVKVTRTDGLPSIAITSPLDNAYLPGGPDIPVSGAYVSATGGARIDINSAPAAIDADRKEYAGSTAFSTTGGTTPIIARISDATGNIGFAAVRVHKLASDFVVVEAFPPHESLEVSPGVIVLVSFSHPVDLTTLDAVTLTGPDGVVTTAKYAQETIVSLAPTALLQAGATYTLRATVAVKNVAGTPLKNEFVSTFTVANTGGGSAPQIDDVVVECGKPIVITGQATPGARLLLETGGFRVNGVADASGRFALNFPSTGQGGWHVVRVRTAGTDGSLSPAAEKTFRIDCAGPRVVSASFDRSVNTFTIHFSKPVKQSTLVVGATGSIVLTTAGGVQATGTATASDATVTVVPVEDLSAETVTLVVNDGVTDLSGAKLVAAHTQLFSVDDTPTPSDGDGYISGEVYDATNGRPLKTAQITVTVPATAFARTPSPSTSRVSANASPQIAVTGSADSRGRYTLSVPEGAHTIEAGAPGYTTAWRQIIVPAGAGIVPIDIRLTQRGPVVTSEGAALALEHGGENAVTKKVKATLPASLPAGTRIALTSVGAQSLAGLLPLGWSPLASAELAVLGDGNIPQLDFPLPGAQVSFELPDTTRTLSLVQYDEDRDEWITVAAVLTKDEAGKWTAPVTTSGAYAVVYGDAREGLVKPVPATTGAALQGVTPNCGTTATPCNLVKKDFTVNPKTVTPTQSAVAHLTIHGTGDASFPSGTAVQAYVTEVLTLPGGGTVLDAPFATDLLLYRTLDEDAAEAIFNIAPSANAKNYVIQEGVDHIQILHYPGRLDRGTLIGSEGGAVPGDDLISVEIPSGATLVELHASSRSLTAAEQQSYAPLEGYDVVGGLLLTMSRATPPQPSDADGDGVPDPVPPVELLRAARVTATIDSSRMTRSDAQLLLAEIVEDTPFRRIVRLAVPLVPVDAAQETLAVRRYTTRTIDPADLPVDGVIREGRYLVLAAKHDLAWATGTLRLGAAGPSVRDAKIASHLPNDVRELGVTDITRPSGVFAIPVSSQPAAGWTIVPRSVVQGTGAPVNSTQAAVRNETIRLGDVVLDMQPPLLESITPDGSQQIDPAQPFTIRIDFNMPIDVASARAAVSVMNQSTNVLLNGDVTVANDIVTFTPKQPLIAGATYTLSIGASLAGTNGAPFGRTHTVAYRMKPDVPNDDIRPDRVHISVPKNGVSRVWGDVDALPGGWLVVAIRRGNDFIETPSKTVNSDGSFTMNLGEGPAEDRVTNSDVLDLQVVNPAGNVGALIRLTPFVTDDGLGFVAPAGAAVTFTSREGITVHVPEAAFAKATLVTVQFETNNDAFNGVPNLTNEMDMLRAVKLDFEGVAARDLALSIPLGNASPDRPWLLAQLLDTVRGPRVALVDMFRVEGTGTDARLTTTLPPPASGARRVGTNAGIQDLEIKSCLVGISQAGVFAPVDLKVGGGLLGWITMEFERVQNVMMDLWRSIWVPDFAFGSRKNCVAMPIIKGRAFTITGVDGATGLDTFKKVYQPIPITDPGVTFPVENPNPDLSGPYPIYGAPFRVESLRMLTENYEAKGYRLTLDPDSGVFTFTANPPGTPAAERLAAKTKVRIYNVTKVALTGEEAVSDSGTLSFTADVEEGDDIVVYVGAENVAPETAMSVVFNEPFDVGELPEGPGVTEAQRARALSDNLRKNLKLELEQEAFTTDLTKQAQFGADTQNRRLRITLPASLVRGGRYRLTVTKDMKDTAGNPVGSKRVDGDPGDGFDFTFEWVIRANPNQLLGAFQLRQIESGTNAQLRDIAKSGNLAFVAALEGGVLAYDLSDPASLNPDASSGEQPKPISFVPARGAGVMGFDEHWSVAVDQHGRVYSGGLMPSLSAIRSYRLEDFLEARDNPHAGCPDPAPGEEIPPNSNCKFNGATIVGWRPGYASAQPMSTNFVIGNTPEAYPRHIELLTQDDTKPYKSLHSLMLNPTLVRVVSTTPSYNPASPPPADTVFEVKLKFEYPSVPGKYMLQRITVRNETLDLTWSKDVYLGESVEFDIVMRATDYVTTLRNDRTYAVVDLFGYGAGVYDLNAVESNDVAIRCADSAFAAQHGAACGNAGNNRGKLEMLLQTPATKASSCNSKTLSLAPDAIPHLNFSPVIHAVVPKEVQDNPEPIPDEVNYEELRIFGLDSNRGVLDLTYELPDEENSITKSCATRPSKGLVFRDRPTDYTHPRLKKIQEKVAKANKSARFSDAAMAHWQVSESSNLTGLRGSYPLTAVSRDYLLVAGGAYGLLVVDVAGDKAKYGPEYDTLGEDHLADVIWVPAGAVAVRAIPKSNLATVLDGKGRLLLVDLSNIDERWGPPAGPNEPATLVPGTPFPTATKAMETDGAPGEIGADDPRIIYKSQYVFATRPLAPIVDPETGIAFGGDLATRDMKVAAVLDPAVELLVDAGSGLAPTGGIVPLGVAPPLRDGNLPVGDPGREFPTGALSSFRVRVSLPGAIAKSLPDNQITLALESERVFGSDTEQTPDGMPRAHLRKRDRNNQEDPRDVDFKLRWVMPNGDTPAEQEAFDKKYRHMQGYNHLISDWVVAIADPRASIHVQGTDAEKKDAGCVACVRPKFLENKTEAEDDVYEFFTKGRFIAVRPGSFGTTKYDYLNKAGRLEVRIPTTMADTVREKHVDVAPIDPPAARGLLQERTYVHSGEVEVSALDLVLSGRAGMDAALARTYRSRTIGGTVLGLGWEAPYLRRLRQMADGKVEFRDGAGEIWTFEPLEADPSAFPLGVTTGGSIDRAIGTRMTYKSPPGLFLKLVRHPNGWMLFDQKWRVVNFDNLGRIVSESDEFWVPNSEDDGNVFQYGYDPEGRLSAIVDPVGRITNLRYWKSTDSNSASCETPSDNLESPCTYPNLLGEIEDWRERKVTFEYDKHGRLIAVQLPAAQRAAEVPTDLPEFSTPDKRPRTEYVYQTPEVPSESEPVQSEPYTNFMYWAGNLEEITDPQENVPGSSSGGTPAAPTPRVKFEYFTEPDFNDRVHYQYWPCANYDGSCAERQATFTYTPGLASTLTNVIDILGQQRDYMLAEQTDKRYHITKETVLDVDVMKKADPAFPDDVGVNEPTEPTDLVTSMTYNDQGAAEITTLPSGLEREVHMINAPGGAPGKIVEWIKERQGGTERQTTFHYEPDTSTNPNSAATVVAVSRKQGSEEVRRDAQTGNRERKKTQSYDAAAQISNETELDAQGRPTLVSQRAGSGSAPPEPGTGPLVNEQKLDYFGDDSDTDENQRGRVEKITSGSDLESTFVYETAAPGGMKVTATDVRRNIKTVTTTDSWDRVIAREVTDSYGTLAKEAYVYDATGRLVYSSRTQKDIGKAETFITYDILGRTVKTVTTGNNVMGAPGRKITQTAKYDLTGRQIVETDPFLEGGTATAELVSKIDFLGRTYEREHRAITSGSTSAPAPPPLKQKTAYDIHGVPVYSSDTVRTASLARSDIFGRTVATKSSDDLQTEHTWDVWDQPVDSKALATNGVVVGRTKNFYTPNGRLLAVNEGVDIDHTDPNAGRTRHTHFGWGQGGQSETRKIGEVGSFDAADVGSGDPVRMWRTGWDTAGRVIDESYGDAVGISGIPSTPWLKREYRNFLGTVAREVREIEPQRGDETVVRKLQYDGLDRVRESDDGGYVSTVEFDEAGNPTLVTPPAGVGKVTSTFDARGLQITEAKVGGTITRQYDERGLLRVYQEEGGGAPPTTYTPDALGRVTDVSYPDGSSEHVEYDTAGQVSKMRDRAGQWLSYKYDNGGRVVSIHSGEEPTDNNRVVVYSYDLAKRLFSVRTKDAETQYDFYDLLGRPGRTISRRFQNDTGLEDDAGDREILDEHTQRHTWSIHDGERLSWTMPVKGDPASASNPAPFRTKIEEHRNASLNVWKQLGDAATIATANNGSVGRVTSRARTLGGGAEMATSYGFADAPVDAAFSSPQQPESGMLRIAKTTSGGNDLAGAEIFRNASGRIGDVRDLGLASRISAWSYDQRGRLLTSKLLKMEEEVGSATPIRDHLLPADFRKRRELTTEFGPSEHEKIGDELSFSVEPLEWTAEKNNAHAVESRTLLLDGEPFHLDGETSTEKDFSNDGGRRMGNGDWTYEYDEFQRVIAKQRDTRRIEYDYDGNGRIVGRRARSGNAGVWTDDADSIVRDGLPARTTWVWDPITDRLVAVYAEGGALVRQYVHGDRGADDPVEVLIAESPNGPVKRYYPILDETGSGSLQAIVGADGKLVERVLYGDAYGDEPRYLQGAVVDRVTYASKKNPVSGAIEEVTIRVHLSEKLDPDTIAVGSRLVAVKTNGDVAASAPAAVLDPDDEDGATLMWDLDASEWQALSTAADAESLEIAVNNSLGTPSWGSAPVQRVPVWAPKVFAGVTYDATKPVIVRSKFPNLESRSGDGNPEALYEIKSLYMAASVTSKTRLHTDFHAYPFREPADGTIFVRARWYDPATGAFLTPDPMGYADASNAYALCANDPVNCSDPTGQLGFFDSFGPIDQALIGKFAEKYATDAEFASDVDALADVTMQALGNPYVQGTLQVVGGCGEAIVGGAAVFTGAGTIPGAVAFVHGGDICVAGVRTLYTGEVHESFFNQGSMYVLKKAGMSEDNARLATMALDMGVGAYGSVGSAAALRNAASAAPGSGSGLLPGGSAARKLLGEYRRFKGQGFAPREARYLTQLYDNGRRMGQHFPVTRRLARRWGLPLWLRDSPLNVLKPRGINLGRFYELHYRVDPDFMGAALGRGMRSWSGRRLGLQKITGVRRYIESTPHALRWTIGGGAAGGGALWWLSQEDDE